MNAKLARPSLAGKHHPLTGKKLGPVGYVNGRAVWPILGGAEEEEDPEGGAGGGAGSTNETPLGGETNVESGGEKGAGDPNAKIAALEEEKDRHYNARKQAEEERDDLRGRLKALEDKDKDDSTKLTERVTDLETNLVKSQNANKQLSLENAFLKDNTYQWYDPDDALRLADLSQVDIDKEGNVKGLKDSLEKLAKTKPHLVKPKEEQNGSKPPNSGDPAHGHKKKKDDLDRDALVKKYPALRR